MNLDAGEVVDRYQIEAQVGEGGMARVYRVRHTSLGTLHALKLLTVPSQAVRERLMQEGRVQASLKHPNIVAVHDIIDVDGSPGLVMEYIDGPSLSALLHHMHPLGIEQIDALAAGIFDGVAHAHGVGVVHRDLKPANILLAIHDGVLVPKITDFGLAKLLATDRRDSATRSGVAMGTPSYMAPEQVRDSKAVGPLADVWSLGAILFELVTGQRAFLGDDLFETYQRVTSGERVDVATLRDDLPARMRSAIDAALQVDAHARSRDVASLRQAWLQDAEPSVAVWDAGELERAAALGFGGRPWSVSESIAPSSPTGSRSLETYVEPEPGAVTFSGVSIASDAAVTPEPLPDLPATAPSPTAPSWRVPIVAVGILALLGLGAAVAWVGASSPPRPKAETDRPEPVPAEPEPEPPAPLLAIPELQEGGGAAEPGGAEVPAPSEPMPAPEPQPQPKPPTPRPAPVPTPLPAAPQPVEPVPPAPQPTAQRAASIHVSGADRAKLLEVSSGRVQPPGPVSPGQWRVIAIFNDTPVDAVVVDVSEGQQVTVSCSKFMSKCQVDP